MTVYEIDPRRDPRWPEFLEQHPRSSIFHTSEWLETLWRSYGYESFALTTAAPGKRLRDGLVFCKVKSWLTGRRLVSIPFADHCEPLVDVEESFQALLTAASGEAAAMKARYVEIRPIAGQGNTTPATHSAGRYWLHQLDLRPSLDELFRGLHKDCIQRKIRRAERENLCYEEGTSQADLERFYRLVVLTRRRQQLPPQPLSWFSSLINCMGRKLKIRLASKGGQTVAGILTLLHKDTMVYKYGCSDAAFHNAGGMSMLLWKAIQEAKQNNLRRLDLGRSDWLDQNLAMFKDRWGAERSVLGYRRLYTSATAPVAATTDQGWKELTVRKLVPRLPDSVLCAAGSLLYRHLG